MIRLQKHGNTVVLDSMTLIKCEVLIVSCVFLQMCDSEAPAVHTVRGIDHQARRGGGNAPKLLLCL